MDKMTSIFPSEMTPLEQCWLSTALKRNFTGRGVILEQLSTASIEREVGFDNREIFFTNISSFHDLRLKQGEILFIDAYRPAGIHIEAQLTSLNGAISTFSIYTPDGSKLLLPDIPLDDVDYSIYAYESEASELVCKLYSSDGYNAVEDPISTGQSNQRILRVFQDIGIELRSSIQEYGIYELGPLSRSLRFSLGHDGGTSYDALLRCSLIGDFYFLYVIKNGNDRAFQKVKNHNIYKKVCKLRYIENYPNGYMLGKAQEILWRYGFKPLSGFMLEKKVPIEHNCKISEISILDALFISGAGQPIEHKPIGDGAIG